MAGEAQLVHRAMGASHVKEEAVPTAVAILLSGISTLLLGAPDSIA